MPPPLLGYHEDPTSRCSSRRRTPSKDVAIGRTWGEEDTVARHNTIIITHLSIIYIYILALHDHMHIHNILPCGEDK